MDVLGNGKIQSSFRKLRYNTSAMEERSLDDSDIAKDEGIFHQTFTHHWEACRDRIRDYEPDGERCSDDILTVGAQLEQMIQLLQLELGAGNNNPETRILDTILSDRDNILAQIVGWAKSLPNGKHDVILSLLLQLSEVLVSCKQSGQSVVSHTKVVQPLLSLLDIVNNVLQHHTPSQELQSSLLCLIHSLCVLLTENPSLLELFTCSDPSTPKFLLFSLLTPFLHKPSQEGQMARDSLLLCISLSSQHQIVQKYIADHSNFCTILATGLSGLYSSLPRYLEADNLSWHRLEPEDGQDVPGLEDMLTSLELCSAVLQLASVKLAAQLLDLIYHGFLVPVLGPALSQETDTGAVVSCTVYVDLFIRVITSSSLLATWVKFLFTASVDNKLLIDILIERLSSSGQLCMTTMQLFESLVSLNMEDVMLSLVFKHLHSCNFLLPSFRTKLNYSDPHGRAAYKFLSLVPVSCDPPATPVTPRRTPFFNTSGSTSLPVSSHLQSQSYAVYLSDAQHVIRQTHRDCQLWRNNYDGIVSSNQNNNQNFNKSPVNQVKLTPKISIELGHDPLEDSEVTGSGPGSLGADTSGYLSGGWEIEADGGQENVGTPVHVQLSLEEEEEFWSAVGYSDTRSNSRQKLVSVLARLQHEDRLSMSSYGSEDVISPRTVTDTKLCDLNISSDSPPTLGPLLTALLNRVSTFADNGLGVNLRLTALVSKLATYPQPLLKAVLLHPDVVVQPSCSTLFQAICTARQKIDSIMPGLVGADEAVRSAKDDLHNRIEPHKRSASTTSIISLPATLDAGIRRGGSSFLRMFTSKKPVMGVATQSNNLSVVPSVPPHTRKMAMAAVLLEEWLQELAALAQEHSVLLHQEKIFHHEDLEC